MTREGYDAYIMYLALQRHFSTDYDFFKFNGKVKASKEAYGKRNDMFSFEKLGKIIPRKDWVDFFVCHFLENPKEWIRNMTKQNLESYQSKLMLFPKRFKEDLEAISMRGASNVMAVNEDIPIIHKMTMDGTISLETLCVLDKIYPFLEKHEEQVAVPFAFPEHIKKAKKYKPFISQKTEADHYKYIDTFKDVFNP